MLDALSRRTRGRRLDRQTGAVAIIVGLSMAVLIGFVGLALDLGRLYVAKSELQNSADACALAAAQAITGVSATQLAIAELDGITTGERNRVLFQDDAVDLTENESVEFSETLDGIYRVKTAIGPTEALGIKYARCTARRGAIPTWFIQVLNIMPGIDIGTQAVGATAVATRIAAQTNCALPVAICSGDLTPSTPRGTWLEGTLSPGSGMTGSFKWVDFTPPGGGASEVGGLLKGSGTCNLPSVGAQVGQPGVISSVADEWNSRFGIYKGSTTPAEAIPDFTGYAYTSINWPTRFNAYPDFRTRRTSNAPYQGNSLTGLNVQGTIRDAGFLGANGADRRLAIAPVVDCGEFVTGNTATVQKWACMLMLHPINNSAGGGGSMSGRMYLEYRGLSTDPDSPCASLGMPGNGSSLGPLVPTLVQ